MGGLRALRRGQIITQARRIVAEDGLEALTIGALEKGLEFSRGVITYHFRGKDEIVEAVLLSAVAEIDARLAALSAQPLGPAEQVEAVLRTVLQGFLDHPEAGRILLSFWGRIPSSPRIREINAQLYRNYRRWSAMLISSHPQSFRAVDVEGMSGLLVGIVIGLATQTYFDPGVFDPEPALREAIASVLARLGVASPQASSS